MKSRGMGLLVSMALVGALLVPFSLAVTAGTSAADPVLVCPTDEQDSPGVAQGEIEDVCCRDELMMDSYGLTQGRDVGVNCCPNGEFGHWEWGGTNGQNLYYCDAPPNEPPATSPPATDPPAVSPAASAPKKAAAAAKPTFTG